MDHSESIVKLATSLAAFNAGVKNPTKDKTAEIRPRDSNKTPYSYGYADLDGITEVVRPELAEHGLSVVQDVVVEDRRVGAASTILHTSGEWITFSPVWMPVDSGAVAKDVGGAITYSRRFSLMAALNLAPADDGDAPRGRRQQGGGGGGNPHATAAQIAKLDREIAAGDFTEAQVAKALAGYGASEKAKLTKPQISEFIDRVMAARSAPAGVDLQTGEVPPDDGDPGPDDDDAIGFDEGPPGMDAEQFRARRDQREDQGPPPGALV